MRFEFNFFFNGGNSVYCYQSIFYQVSFRLISFRVIILRERHSLVDLKI